MPPPEASSEPGSVPLLLPPLCPPPMPLLLPLPPLPLPPLLLPLPPPLLPELEFIGDEGPPSKPMIGIDDDAPLQAATVATASPTKPV